MSTSERVLNACQSLGFWQLSTRLLEGGRASDQGIGVGSVKGTAEGDMTLSWLVS